MFPGFVSSIFCFNLRPCRGGGVDAPPHEFFWNGFRTAGRIVLKFRIAYGSSVAQLLAKTNDRVRSRSYDVMRGTASDRFFKEIVFSAT